jgi:mono/diheme cytochrome c family protein
MRIAFARPGRRFRDDQDKTGVFERRRARSGQLVWGLALGLLPGFEAGATGVDLLRGQRHYEAACAACHGPTGRYDPALPGVKLLDPKPADLSDPLFNSREPGGDWFMVIKHGGAPMGFSASMPAYREAFTVAEIEELVAYLKTLPGPHNYPPGDLNYFRPLRTKKAWLEDEVVLQSRFARHDRDGDDVAHTALEFEKRWFARWQTELKLSHEFEGSHGDWDEFEAGVKYALYDNLEHTFLLSGGTDLAFALRGDASMEFIPYLAAAKGLGEAFTLQASLKSHLPPEDASEGDVELAAMVHWIPTPWPRGIFPGVELTATAPFEPGERDALQWTVLPQLNFGLSRRGHVRAAAGVELPLNDRTYDFRLHFYLLWDFADGMFWEGWRRGRTTATSDYE